MNPSALRTFLVLLWLVPGLVLLVLDLWGGGPAMALPVAGRQAPLSWLFLGLAALNLLRWWSARRHRAADDEWAALRNRRRRRDTPPSDPDPNFLFDDPAAGPR